MSENQPPTTTEKPKDEELVLPLPAIICIAIGAYILIVVIILFVRSMLLQRGICKDQCQCCGKEGEPYCCDCWLAFAETCNCCKNPNLTACLDSICPRRKQMDCADIIMCNVCMDENNQCSCCGGASPICDCGNCKCNCNCQPPACDDINCFCCQLQGKNQADLESNMDEDE